MSWNQGLCPWDILGMALRRELRQRLALEEYLDEEWEGVAEDLEATPVVSAKQRERTQCISRRY
jgi:DNA-binding transcriptional regulator/RsmH inhibitor MraZ